MTFAPAPLSALAAYWVAHGGINSGIVGDTGHVATGTSYHLGRSQLAATAYSRQLPRDIAGLSEAAAALDLGHADKTKLRAFSRWLVEQCRRQDATTRDVREIIYTPDGVTVYRWDDLDNAIKTGPGQGDTSHLWHTHISFYRDSESREKVGLFKPYFEEADVTITAQVRERWHPTQNAAAPGTSNGVLRATPDRGAAIVKRIPLGGQIVTVAEVSGVNGENFRLVETPDRAVLFALRSDWISDGFATPEASPAELDEARLAGRREEWDRQRLNAEAIVTLAPKP